MIITETVTIGDRQFRRTYSDTDMVIRKVGTDEHYSEAYDIPESNYTYEETDQPVTAERVHLEQIDSGLPIRMELDSRVIDRKEI